MSDSPRKKSPRAPSLALDDAIEKALRIYEKETRHAAPVDVIANHLGYKSATNGAALTALATLRYYGLIERPREGMIAVSKDVESYKFAPEEKMRREITLKWLRMPPLFSELLEKYKTGLPSDANIKFDLIQRGFNEKAADAVLTVFRRSLDFTAFFETQWAEEGTASPTEVADTSALEIATPVDRSSLQPEQMIPKAILPSEGGQFRTNDFGGDIDRIPIRLTGGRRAWIEVPIPLYGADKERIKAQIDLLLTDDDE